MIFSKWEIAQTEQYVYHGDACVGMDCRAAKGAVYARVLKPYFSNGEMKKQAFNIFATHLQAWNGDDEAKARTKQLKSLVAEFLPALGIPADGSEPVLFQGDFNIDDVFFPDQVEDALRILNGEIPERVGEQVFSADPSTNFLVGKDGGSEVGNCWEAYWKNLNLEEPETGKLSGEYKVRSNMSAFKAGVRTETHDGKPLKARYSEALALENNQSAYCPCCPHENYDFIIWSKDKRYLQPSEHTKKPTLEIVPLKHFSGTPSIIVRDVAVEGPPPLQYDWNMCKGSMCLIHNPFPTTYQMLGADLSDHYPVVANFQFRPSDKPAPILDGCKTHEDCHYDWFRCYCDGPGCTLDGKQVSGWDLGHANRVNKNCIDAGGVSMDGTCFCLPGDGASR